MKIDKNANFSDWYNEVIKEAELCDLRYNIKGFIVIMPWAMKSIDAIYGLYERELEKTNHSPAFFPSLIPERAFKTESDHVEGFVPEVMWVTEAGDKKLEERYALKPTGETSIYPMYALWVNGASDLPIKIYQRNWVWRYETKATKPFIRGREFLWIEAHDVFGSLDETRAQILEDIEMAKAVIWNGLGIPFTVFRRPQWDKFAGADDTFAVDTIMPDGKVLQIATTHMLGQRFAKAFKIKYTNEKGESAFAHQTCYGPGISRIYSAMFSVHGDDKGLVLPFHAAPVQVAIVPILRKGSEEKVSAAAIGLEKRLLAIGIRAKADLRNQTPGFKFNYWEQKGVSLRVEVGERDLASGTLVLATRDDGKKENIPDSELETKVTEAGSALTLRLKEKALAFFTNRLDCAENAEELAKKVEEGKMVLAPFCTDQMEGKDCAAKLKEKYACDVRGTVFSPCDSEGQGFAVAPCPKGKKCVICGKDATVEMHVARQY